MNEYPKVSYALHIVLIEIRAASTLRTAQVYADIMHNVPMMMHNARPEADIIAEIMAKAKRQGVASYFSKLLTKADQA